MNHTNKKMTTGADSRLAAYATLAGAALAAQGIPNADAAIVFSGPVNITIPSNTTGIYLNVVTGVVNSNSALVAGWDINPWNSTSLNFFTPTPNPGGGEMVGTGLTYFRLDPGFFVGPGSTFASNGQTTINAGTPLNFNSSQNYVGFRFINEAAGNQIQYGWMQIALSDSAGAQPRTIVSYAYENTGAGLGGMIPEPASVSLLTLAATGAFGVRAWRKRKRRK